MAGVLHRFIIVYILTISLVTIALATYSVHASSLNNLSTAQVDQTPSAPSPIKFEYSYSPQWYELSTDLSEYPSIPTPISR